MKQQPLRFGAAYHGNRILHHAREDMLDMATSGMELVVHTFSHTDMTRHKEVMREIVGLSEDAGLEVWVDAWGLGGPPGDVSHFLAFHPESHMYYSDETQVPTYACLSDPSFRRFIHEWIDAVAYIGGKTIFWDEPHMPVKSTDGGRVYGCACPTCRARFEERFGKPMPLYADDDTEKFANETVYDYFREVTEYSASLGIKNTVCVMLGRYGMSLENASGICSLPHMDSIGSDPYWIGKKKRDPSLDIYDFVRGGTEQNIALCDKCGKDHNIWIQTYSNPRGSEEDIVLATEAAYDGGARNIFAWGYYGSSSNDYGAKNAPVAWAKYREAVFRVREIERDKIAREAREAYEKISKSK